MSKDQTCPISSELSLQDVECSQNIAKIYIYVMCMKSLRKWFFKTPFQSHFLKGSMTLTMPLLTMLIVLLGQSFTTHCSTVNVIILIPVRTL